MATNYGIMKENQEILDASVLLARRRKKQLLELRERSLLIARKSLKEKRFEEMRAAIEELVKTAEIKELSAQERYYLTLAYRFSMRPLRNFWKLWVQYELVDPEVGRRHRMEVEKKMREVCDGLLKLLDRFLLPNCKNMEAKVLYLRLKGDYNRYIAEIGQDDIEATERCSTALQCYKLGRQEASSALDVSHPFRLALELNMAVLHYRCLNLPENALAMAKYALECAERELKKIHHRLQPTLLSDRVAFLNELRSFIDEASLGFHSTVSASLHSA